MSMLSVTKHFDKDTLWVALFNICYVWYIIPLILFNNNQLIVIKHIVH